MASPEEVWNQTGYEIGTVAPFGLRPDLSILIDKHILDHEVISFGSGRKQSAIIMETNEFCKHLENHTAIEFIR